MQVPVSFFYVLCFPVVVGGVALCIRVLGWCRVSGLVMSLLLSFHFAFIHRH